MALEKNMNQSKIETFLSEEVKEQVLYEIAPILHLGYAPGGYFGVTRQILCLVDFLGALYSGFDQKNDVTKYGKRIASSQKALSFIEDIFGEIDRNYKVNGKYLYKMYRNGLVHLYQPKELKIGDGKVLTWLSYKGGRTSDIQVGDLGIIKNAKHLEICTKFGRHYFPVSIRCLYADLLTSIDIFLVKLRKSQKLRDKWISAANEICEPDKFNDKSERQGGEIWD